MKELKSYATPAFMEEANYKQHTIIIITISLTTLHRGKVQLVLQCHTLVITSHVNKRSTFSFIHYIAICNFNRGTK